ncbi:MAG: amidohydrolase family protein [Firmicutes bacterium]|nr:amidohydrolase family protein [Bacillota bacterium]
MIIDGHAHISDSDVGNFDKYLRQLKAAGIEAGVAVPGGTLDVRRMTDYIIGRAQPSSVSPDNAYLHKAMEAGNGSLFGFYGLDPHASGAAEELIHGFTIGFRGLKLSPLSHQFSFASKAVAELVEICGEHGFPVYSHVLYNPGASTERYVSLARKFPGTNFILGHMGFGPADQDGLRAAIELDNFFLETSTGSFLHIQLATSQAGASKIIFGSEFPLSHPKVELDKILLLDLTADELDAVLGRNIQELMRCTTARGAA